MAYQRYSRASSSSQNDPDRQFAELQQMAESQGVDLKVKKDKPGLLQIISRVLNVGTAASAGIAEYGNPIQGIAENLDYGQVMKKRLGRELTTAEKAEAFAKDVALDPITYLSFGTGTAAKLSGKVLAKSGEKMIAKAGADAAKGIVEKEAARIAKNEAINKAEKEFAEGILAKDPKYLEHLDKGGLKFGGKTIIAGEKTGAAFDNIAGKFVEKAPGVNKLLGGIKDAAGVAVIPNYELTKQMKALDKVGDFTGAEKIRDFIRARKTLGIEEQKVVDKAIEGYKKEGTEMSPQNLEQVTHLIERAPKADGTFTSTGEISEIFEKGRVSQAQTQKEAGLLQKQIDRVGPVENLKGVSKPAAVRLKALGIHTIDDVIGADEAILKSKLKDTFGSQAGQLARRVKVAAIDASEQLSDHTFKVEELNKRVGQIGDETRDLVEKARGSLDNVDDPEVREFAIRLQKDYDDTYKQLHARGLLNAGIGGGEYTARVLTPEAIEKIKDVKDVDFAKGNLSTSIGSFGKHRTNQQTIKEGEEILKRKYGIEGDVYLKNAAENAAFYQARTKKAVLRYDFHVKTMSQFGEQAPQLVRQVRGADGKMKKIKEWGEFTDSSGVKNRVPKIKQYQDAGIAVPEQIANSLEKTDKFLSDEKSLSSFVKFGDKLQSHWKSSVTGIFPAFHVRNILGGVYNNWLAGVTDLSAYKDATALIKSNKAIKGTLSPEAIRAEQKALKKIAFKDSFGREITGQEMLDGYADFIGTGTGKSADMKSISKSFDTSYNRQAIDKLEGTTRGLMSTIEEHIRMPLFIDSWKKTGSFEEAAENVAKYQFDYSKVASTNFENQVMKRLVPFYTWSRNNIPLQIETAIRQPGKQAATLKLFNELVDPEVRDSLPSYIKEGLALQTGKTVNGQTPILSGLGLPIEDLNNVSIRGIAGMLSPTLKAPIEAVTGKSIFYDKDINDLGPQFAKYYKGYPKPIRDFLELKEVTDKDGNKKYTGNPRKLYALQSVAGRLTTSLSKSGDESIPGFQRALNSLTGIRIRSVDIENEKYYKSRELLEAYQKQLQEKGVLKTHQSYYKPKGTTVSDT